MFLEHLASDNGADIHKYNTLYTRTLSWHVLTPTSYILLYIKCNIYVLIYYFHIYYCFFYIFIDKKSLKTYYI